MKTSTDIALQIIKNKERIQQYSGDEKMRARVRDALNRRGRHDIKLAHVDGIIYAKKAAK